jgi:cytochrome c oxidase subunit IV
MTTHSDSHEGHEHHILSLNMGMKVWIILMVLTIITVAIAQIDLGRFNFTVAMIIATVKAAFVVLYFMGMKYDSNENRVIFFSGFLFLGIFIFLTFSDVLFRSPESVVDILPPLTNSTR